MIQQRKTSPVWVKNRDPAPANGTDHVSIGLQFLGTIARKSKQMTEAGFEPAPAYADKEAYENQVFVELKSCVLNHSTILPLGYLAQSLIRG